MGVIDDDDIHQVGCGGRDRRRFGKSCGYIGIGCPDAGSGCRSRVGSGRRYARKRPLGMRAVPLLVASGSARRILWTAAVGWPGLGMARPRLARSGLGSRMGTPGLGRSWLGRWLGTSRLGRPRLASLVRVSGALCFDRERKPIFFCLFQRRDQLAALFRQFPGFRGVAAERVRVRQGKVYAP